MRQNKNSQSKLLIILLFIMVLGCAQVEQIPEQVPKDLPNPVSDFTEKDRFMMGLKWYQQGNFDIARKFWKPLAENGDCDSEYAMGLLYYSGAGVRRDYSKAISLWTKSAEQGQAQSQIALGAAYSSIRIPYISVNCKGGCGVKTDLLTAYKWFSLAAESNSVREVRASEESIRKISDKLSPAQLERANKQIEKWKPNPSQCKSRGVLLAAPGATRVFY